jgi:GMP synthase (glutamine-hydrolysing)
MRKLIILKTGSTLPSLLSRRGDFEDWILTGLGGSTPDRVVLDVRYGASLPNAGDLSGLIITGSHSMVTERLPWSERIAEWLPSVLERDVPVLGICYGHQLLAYALGGEVGDNPHGCEYGTFEIQLSPEAQSDPLLCGLAAPVKVQLGHVQSVLRLPEGARRLAWDACDENQAFIVGSSAWGLQFHPEFDAQVIKQYIRSKRRVLRLKGQDPEALAAACTDTPSGPEILRRFAALVSTPVN